jgi:hypothetical protein
VLSHYQNPEENQMAPEMQGQQVRRTNIKRGQGQNEYLFCGFPGIFANGHTTDILKQVSIVLNLWNTKNCFPIKFEPLYMGQSVKDETYEHIESLSENQTSIVKQIFENLNILNLKQAESNIIKLLFQIGIKGVLTMLGFRKTIGSQEIVWPSS